MVAVAWIASAAEHVDQPATARDDAPVLVTPPAPMPPRYLRALAHDPGGYDPERGGGVTDLLLGDLLFHSPRTLGTAAQRLGLSCAACHPNGAAHGTLALPTALSDRPGNVDLSTGYFRAGADNHVADFVNIPSLRGARFTPPYGRDGRTASLRELITDVVESEFAGAPLAPYQLRALVQYVEDLDFLPNNLLDAHGRLTERASAAALRGQVLFAAPRAGFGGASCATCHPASSFFRDGQVHRLGTGQPPSPHALDDGFETPSLLGTLETAPYFHDGRFATLAEVVAWFDTAFALGVGAGGRADLTAYLDAVGASDRRVDDRPLAQVMIDSFVYLALLVDGEARDEPRVWVAALEAARDELAHHPVAPAIAPAIARARARVAGLLSRARARMPDALAALRPEVAALQRDLFRLAADWAGALAAPPAREGPATSTPRGALSPRSPRPGSCSLVAAPRGR
jgi:hypothetical protein